MDSIEILRRGEGKSIESKRDISSRANIIRTVVAFSNTAIGVIEISVNDNKSVSGVKDPFEIEEKLSSIISNSIAPQFLPNIETIRWRDKSLIAVEIYAGNPSETLVQTQRLFRMFEKGNYS